jgi:hypothetical protein
MLEIGPCDYVAEIEPLISTFDVQLSNYDFAFNHSRGEQSGAKRSAIRVHGKASASSRGWRTG